MKLDITYLHDEPTGRWTAVIDAPSVITEGDTIREARERAFEALKLVGGDWSQAILSERIEDEIPCEPTRTSWRAWFTYEGSESYSTLLKGAGTLSDAAVSCVSEERHGAKCIGIELRDQVEIAEISQQGGLQFFERPKDNQAAEEVQAEGQRRFDPNPKD